MKFSIKNLFSKAALPADLVTFIEEILNGKLHFFAVGLAMITTTNSSHI